MLNHPPVPPAHLANLSPELAKSFAAEQEEKHSPENSRK